MSYTSQAEVEALIPARLLAEALDDDGAGMAAEGMLAQLITNAEVAVDGLIGSAVVLPLAEPLPKSVRRAALVFVLESVHQRRQVSGEANPWSKEADRWRSWLEKVGQGEATLEAVAEMMQAASGSAARVKMRGEG